MPKLLWKNKDADSKIDSPASPSQDVGSPLSPFASHNSHQFNWNQEQRKAVPHTYTKHTNGYSESIGNKQNSFDLTKSLGREENPLETHRSFSSIEISRNVSPNRNFQLRNNALQYSGIKQVSNFHHPIPSSLIASISTPSLHLHSTHINLISSDTSNYQQRNIFDVDEQNEDIMKAAAQREQQKGTGRHIRGTMGPVISKEEDKLQVRKLPKLSEAVVDNKLRSTGESYQTTSSNSIRSVLEPGDTLIAIEVIKGVPETIRSTNGTSREKDFKELATKISRGDIMAQSLRRQSKKMSKSNLNELPNISMDRKAGIVTTAGNDEEFLMFNPADINFSISDVKKHKSEHRSRRNSQMNTHNTHEDVQILNLQGFMDTNGTPSVLPSNNNDTRKKSKRRKSRKGEEFSSEGNHVSRERRRRSTRSKHHDENDIALKDLDDLDDEFGGIIIGPKSTVIAPQGVPITMEEAIDVRKVLTGNAASPLPVEWMKQSFMMNARSNLSYGLVQKKGGPCGVLAAVQAHMMKCLMFGSYVAPEVSPASPLRPSVKEWNWALCAAITEMLWRAGGLERAVLTLPSPFPHFTEYGVGRYSSDGITETLVIHTFTKHADLYAAVEKNFKTFITEDAPAVVLLLYSAIFTRGINNVLDDIDAGSGQFINSHGYASQEVVNLLITGKASTNTFNGVTTLGSSVSGPSASKLTLRGVDTKADIGLLSLFEHYGSCQVGSHLKSPQYPVWVVCSESHYTVLFARQPVVTSSNTGLLTGQFDMYYYDGLALQEDEIRITIRLGQDSDDSPRKLVPPLEHCIRTKWNDASIDWNGTDPLL